MFQVKRKSRLYGEREAELEVILNELVKQKGGRQGALLHVVSNMYGEQKVRMTSED